MSISGDFRQVPTTSDNRQLSPVSVPLLNLSTVRARMDSLQKFLSESVNSNTLIGKHQMDMVSTEISSAIHQIFVNGAALIASTQTDLKIDHKVPIKKNDVSNEIPRRDDDDDEDCEIIELDAVELLAEHIHFCDICGKGFKRDANLRMHMRAHGNQFKTPEALAKPETCSSRSEELNRKKTRFSCPYVGCNRNKSNKKFRALKSVVCVKNHFKRSHCPKMYSCNRCNKKSFSVLADLKSHLKHCGESKWKCSCGTTFSRKDKLFGHMALFEGHMPAVVVEEEEEQQEEEKKNPVVPVEEEEEESEVQMDNVFLDGLFDEFGSIDGFCLQDVLESPKINNDFFNF